MTGIILQLASLAFFSAFFSAFLKNKRILSWVFLIACTVSAIGAVFFLSWAGTIILWCIYMASLVIHYITTYNKFESHDEC